MGTSRPYFHAWLALVTGCGRSAPNCCCGPRVSRYVLLSARRHGLGHWNLGPRSEAALANDAAFAGVGRRGLCHLDIQLPAQQHPLAWRGLLHTRWAIGARLG